MMVVRTQYAQAFFLRGCNLAAGQILSRKIHAALRDRRGTTPVANSWLTSTRVTAVVELMMQYRRRVRELAAVGGPLGARVSFPACLEQNPWMQPIKPSRRNSPPLSARIVPAVCVRR